MLDFRSVLTKFMNLFQVFGVFSSFTESQYLYIMYEIKDVAQQMSWFVSPRNTYDPICSPKAIPKASLLELSHSYSMCTTVWIALQKVLLSFSGSFPFANTAVCYLIF